MTKKYFRMERNHNWLDFKVIMSIVCIAILVLATCNTAHQMGHVTTGLPVVSAHSLVATLNHSSEESDTRDSQHISDTDVKLSTEETEPVLSNSQEATVHKWIFRGPHSQNSELNRKNSIKELLHQNYFIKNRQLIETSKSKQVPVIRFLLQSRNENDFVRNNLPSQQLNRIEQKKLRIKREDLPADPSLVPVMTQGGTTTESNTEMSTTSGGTSNDFKVSGIIDKLNTPNPKIDNTELELAVSVPSLDPNVNVTEAILKPTEGPEKTTLVKTSVQVTTMPAVIPDTSQSGSTTSTTPGVQITVESNLNSTENQEVLVEQTSAMQKLTSSWQRSNLPTTQVPSQTKPHTVTSSVSKSSSMTVPMSTNHTVLLVTNNTALIGSQVEVVHERMSDNELDPAYQLTNDAYWALGSLTTVLLLLTAAVLYTGLWKKRNHMSNPISDVTCHNSPVRKRKTDLKDFLKKKLRHIKTLNLKDSPLTGSMEMSKHYKGRRNGKSNGVHSHRYDTIPLLERPGDDEEDEYIEWEQTERDHSV